MAKKPRKNRKKQEEPEIESWKLDYLREGLLPPKGFYMLNFCWGPDALRLWREIKDEYQHGTFPYAESREADWERGWSKQIEREEAQRKT